LRKCDALVREHVEKFAQQLEEKEDARMQEYQQSLEEWLKRGQREFNKKMAEKVDKFTQESETKVTIVLEMCEQVVEQLRKYESLLKFDDQRPQLEQEWPEQGQPPQKQREAPEELRYEAEKLADNDQAADNTTSMLAQSQREPGEPLNFNNGEVTGGVLASTGSSSVATGSLSPAGFFKSDAPEELRYEAEKLADNDLCDKATSWQTLYQREKIEISEGTDSCRGPNEGESSGVAADTQKEPTLDAADAKPCHD